MEYIDTRYTHSHPLFSREENEVLVHEFAYVCGKDVQRHHLHAQDNIAKK